MSPDAAEAYLMDCRRRTRKCTADRPFVQTQRANPLTDGKTSRAKARATS
jgi:hypothetical protein